MPHTLAHAPRTQAGHLLLQERPDPQRILATIGRDTIDPTPGPIAAVRLEYASAPPPP